MLFRSRRVLVAEHVLYPRAVGWFVRDQLRLEGGRVAHCDNAAQYWLHDAAV